MFDLERQIARWKSGFAKRRGCSSDELEELESHLREEIASLVAAGHSQEAAFFESVARLGEPDKICSEFSKNERRQIWDQVAIRGNSVVVAMVGLAAAALGVVVWMKREDGLLGAHQGSITFGYAVGFLLAIVGTYAIFRAALVESTRARFRDQFAGHCRILLGIVAVGSAIGAVLGGMWAQRHWGRFWDWDLKETGAFAVVVCAFVLSLLVGKFKLTSVRLGQVSLMMSLVIFVAWFGPAVYADVVGGGVFAVLVVCLVVQLSILGISFFMTKRESAVRYADERG
jgi:hypothetical protein